MLEVGWSELLVIAIILIVVVGPKDLPAMMRTFGRVMGRVRTMANEFRGQFDEAMREAELDDVRKGLGDVNKYNPANAIRDAINPIRQLGQDIKTDLQKASDVSVKTKTDEGTPAAELASDPAVNPEPVKSGVEPAKSETVTDPSKPAQVSVAASSAAAGSSVAASPVAAGAKPISSRKRADKAVGDYPPPPRKAVKRKAAESRPEHDVHVVAGETSVPDAPAARPKAAPRKKTAKTGDA